MVNQVKGQYNAKEETMKKYLNIAQMLIVDIDDFSIEYIPRETNQVVDTLSKFAFKDHTRKYSLLKHTPSQSLMTKK